MMGELTLQIGIETFFIKALILVMSVIEPFVIHRQEGTFRVKRCHREKQEDKETERRMERERNRDRETERDRERDKERERETDRKGKREGKEREEDGYATIRYTSVEGNT